MPLKLNVGASKKVADASYGSRGASINMEIELESALIADPQKLQHRIRQLFDLIHQSLADEIRAGERQPSSPPRTQQPAHTGPPTNGRQPVNGKHSPTVRMATPAQLKALHGIAKRLGFDLLKAIRNRFEVERPDQLSLQQASELIDSLKSANT